MSKRIAFDEQVENHLKEIQARLKAMGIMASKPMALKYVIEMNKAAQIKIKRKRRSRFGLIFQ